MSLLPSWPRSPTLAPWIGLALLAITACSTSEPHSVDLAIADTSSPDAAAPDATLDAATPLTVLAAGATEGAVTDEASVFEAQTGLSYTFTIGSAGALRDLIIAGAKADVALVTPAVISALAAKNLVVVGSRVDLGTIGGGVAVRAGDPPPLIDTEAAFAQALSDADAWYYADPTLATAGAAFVTIATKLGFTSAQIAAKSHLAAGGKEAMLALAAATEQHPLGVTQLSEIKAVPAVTYVGPYPGTLQTTTTYAAIILQSSARAAEAAELVQFFAGPDFKARLQASGFVTTP